MAERKKVVGKRIQEARLGKRWKQKELAAAVSVEPMTVSRWERGEHMPDLDMLERIAKVTDRPLSFFLDDPEQQAAEADLLVGLQAVVSRLEMVADRLEGQASRRSARDARRPA